jgi:hypothetical protein
MAGSDMTELAALGTAVSLASAGHHGFWELVEGNLGGLQREPMSRHHGAALQA